MVNDVELSPNIEPCRTCGIFYLASPNILVPLFFSSEMEVIRKELELWKIQLEKDERLPQYICKSCIYEFEKAIKLRTTCEEMQSQWSQWRRMEIENQAKIKVKTEINEEPDELCTFIYIDDSDGEEESNNAPIAPRENEELDSKAALKELLNKPIKQEPGTTTEPALETPAGKMQSIKIENQSYEEQQTSESIDLECKACLFIAKDYQELRQHTLRIHETKNIQCTICNRQFRDAMQLKYHLKWHQLHRHNKCMQCGFYCSTKEALREHKRAVHTKIACNICAKHILPRKLKQHMLLHETDNVLLPTNMSIKCEYCLSRFNNSDELEQHRNTFHKPYNNATFDTINNIPDDETNLGVQRKEQCPSSQQLENHTLENHNGSIYGSTNMTKDCSNAFDGSGSLGCQDSPQVLKLNANNFDATESTFTSENNSNPFDGSGNQEYTESNDTLMFGDSTTASAMETIDDGEKSTEDYLLNNDEYPENAPVIVQSETGTKYLQGGGEFNQHGDLNVEPSDFSAEEFENETFACSQCDNSFFTIQDLKHHYSIEHEVCGPPFKCSTCGKSFKLQFRLKQHLKKHIAT